jgi:succinoglycan biosynthesis transport protein ExoP
VLGDLITCVKSNIKSLIANDDAETPELLPPTDEQLRIMLAYGIQSMVTVDGGKQSQIINIGFESDNPAEAAEIINTVADAYIEFGLEARLSTLKDTAKWLGDQLEDLKITLQTSEDKLSVERTQSGLMDSRQQALNTNTQLSSLNTELVRAQTQLSQASEIFSQVQKLDRSKGDYLALGPVLQNLTVSDLVREESNQSRQVEELAERYGENTLNLSLHFLTMKKIK